MGKRFYLLIIPALCFCGSIAYAQPYALRGKVINEAKQPVAFVPVSLLKNDTLLIGQAPTDSSGNFYFKVERGRYLLIFEPFGAESVRKVVALDQDLNIGDIAINESALLEGITITARKKLIERKADRLIFNVAHSVMATGGDAMAVLKVTPGLRVKNEVLSMVGKGAVGILINGRLIQLAGGDLVNYLQTISSNDIKSVEVISNPPAQYSAEGNSGLVNIILKPSKKNHFLGDIRGVYQKSRKSRGDLGGGISYQKDRLSLLANTTIRKGSVLRTETMKVFYPIQLWNLESDAQLFTKFLSGRVGVDYDITKNTSIGIQYLGNANSPDIKETIRTTIIKRPSNAPDSLIFTNGYTDAQQSYHALNAHFKSKIDSLGKTILVDVDYLKYNNDLERQNNSDNFMPDGSKIFNSENIFKIASAQDIAAFTATINVDFPIKFINLSFGGKISILKNSSKNQTFNFEDNDFILDTKNSDHFTYREHTQAVYINTHKTLEKWDFQAGLRFEATQIQGISASLNQTNKNRYQKFFPTIYVSYNPNDHQAFSLNYGKRISRPNYQRLNPFRWFANPFSYSEGNPFLLPSFTDNIELSHTYKNKLNSSLYFSRLMNGADQITIADIHTTLQATVWRNFIQNYAVGLTESYQLDRFKWFESYIQVNLSYLKVTATIPNTLNTKQGVNFDFSLNNTIILVKEKLIGEINYQYEAPGVVGVNDFSSSGSLDLGLRWTAFNKSLNVALVVEDVLKTNIATVKGLYNQLEVQYRNYYDTRRARLSVSYRFGNKKLKSKQRQFSNEDERKRLY